MEFVVLVAVVDTIVVVDVVTVVDVALFKAFLFCSLFFYDKNVPR